MFVDKASGIKKRRAPLPEEVYPNLVKDVSNLVNETCDDSGATSAERLPMTLPLTEPATSRQNLVALEKDAPSSRKSCAPDSGAVKLFGKRRSLDDIDFLSNNEALDVQRQSENVKALENIEYHNGHHKRNSSSDVSKTLHKSSSKTSLRSFASSEESFLLNSLTSSSGTDTVYSQMVCQEDIDTLTAHVRHFSDALSNLRIVFPGNGSGRDSDENTDGGNAAEEMNVKLHESLGKVLSNLKEVINRYPSLKAREILAAADNLITIVRNFNNVDNENHDEFYHAIDQLALVFGCSISNLLVGDLEVSPNEIVDRGRSLGDGGRDQGRGGYHDQGGRYDGGRGGGRYGHHRDNKGPPMPYENFHEPSEDSASERPRLKSLPRTVKDPVNDIANSMQQAKIFGGAKPRDKKQYEQKQAEIERKRKESESSEEDNA